MRGYHVTREPPAEWHQACAASNNLFHDPAWASVLRAGLGAEPLYAWNPDLNRGALISVFRKGPFRIGYLGFPVGGMTDHGPVDAGLLVALGEHRQRPQLLRIPVSGFAPVSPMSYPGTSRPETAIVNLRAWDQNRLPGARRRDLRKADESGLRVERADDAGVGDSMYGLYRTTVLRYRGSLRYTSEYFSRLVMFGAERQDLCPLLAWHGEQLAAFLVVVRHGADAYYLHGSSEKTLQHLRPADLLLREAILWARTRQLATFNMMSSPPDQPSLVRFKEKWGGETRCHITYEIAMRAWGARFFHVADSLHKRLFSAGHGGAAL